MQYQMHRQTLQATLVPLALYGRFYSSGPHPVLADLSRAGYLAADIRGYGSFGETGMAGACPKWKLPY